MEKRGKSYILKLILCQASWQKHLRTVQEKERKRQHQPQVCEIMTRDFRDCLSDVYHTFKIKSFRDSFEQQSRQLQFLNYR